MLRLSCLSVYLKLAVSVDETETGCVYVVRLTPPPTSVGRQCHHRIGQGFVEGRKEDRALSPLVPVAPEAVCWSGPWHGWDLLHADAGEDTPKDRGGARTMKYQIR